MCGIKVASSIWMKTSNNFPKFDAWQEGYGAFTYSIREKDMIINYVKNQKEFHSRLLILKSFGLFPDTSKF